MGIITRPYEMVTALLEIFGSDLLAVWPLYGPQLVTHDTVFLSPDDCSTADWTKVACTTPSATTMRETAVAASHRIEQVPSIALGPIASFGWDIEAIGRTWCELMTGGLSYAWFNLTGAGSIGTEVNGTASIEFLGGTRYRCRVFPDKPSAAGTMIRMLGSTGDGNNSYAGDITKGYNIYNAVINQTSIVTAPNIINPGMYDLTNATKASQPVLGADAWAAGYDAAVFSGANFWLANALADRFSGNAKPLAALAAAMPSTIAAGQGTLLALGSSTDAVPYMVWRRNAAAIQHHWRNDASVTAQANHAATMTAAQRAIFGLSKGAAVSGYKNDEPDANNPMAASAGVSTFDRFAFGALINTSFPTGIGHWFGAGRMLALVKAAATPAQMLAASRVIQSHCPLA